ncbi:peptidase [Rhodococcus sp. 06-470-2]|uniref:PepSY-associated TM helix domain-containing protein n=1 Tax=unclassified Rhodococcus (in: high G+C Gram-positive bacteria) TaxID=192944 RepID=UPI000B9B50C3|nr:MULTISPECIES: PepSY domain-containing protein [unclassified Rhodococcus (in: high G+C Gram-positive bacteria)]OZC67976.1 peptidase [Rhodococcus sp. 06-470-2]OZE62495.1 peptidase [Rhodococcus sp. 05-2221-1B]OZE62715.1 peptidase [Rhodococcus sp. 05-2221-1B]
MSTPEMERVADPSPPTRPTSPRSWRPLILRLHFYAGILVAPFILIATISGGLYAVAPTIEQLLYRDYLHVDPTGPAVPVADQIRAAQAEQPDLTFAAVRPATDPGDTTRVMFTDPSLGESKRLAVFVDPSTATSVGESTVYGSSGALPLRTWISELHRHLHLGEPGRLYSELAASWLWVIALGGLYLWVERYRRNRDKTRLLTFDRKSKGRNRSLNWHGVAGIWIAVGLVFLSATGLTWSTYAGENVTELRSALSWTTPAITETIGSSDAATPDHSGHGGHSMDMAADASTTNSNVGRIDSVLDIAKANGIDGAVEASIPASDDAAFVVAETRQPWLMSNNSISIDGSTGTVVDTLYFSDWPLAAKLAAWGIQLHMGTLFGVANQLALLALSVALASVIVRGYMMWWKRRPTKATGLTAGRPPLRGGLRRISPLSVAVLAVVAVAVGWFVPLLGLSLVAFLAVDVVLGSIRRARTRTANAAASRHESELA